MCHPDVPGGQWADARTEEVAVAVGSGEAMSALLALPAEAPAAAVLVIPDIFGRSPFYENLGRRLAAAGYLALVVEYFFREGSLPERTIEAAIARRSEMDERRTIEDLEAAVDWLRARVDVKDGRTGTVGFCMGGTFVLNLAARRSDLAGACFYGFPAARRSPPPGPVPLEEADRIAGPLIGFWGDLDEGVGMDNVADFAAAMAERGVDFSHTVYPGVGHGFLAAAEFSPDHEAYQASVDAWSQTLAFYAAHLR